MEKYDQTGRGGRNQVKNVMKRMVLRVVTGVAIGIVIIYGLLILFPNLK